MDIISFVSNLRQEALLLGDYNAVRGMCSRRLATLRKRLGRANKKKFAQQPPLTAEDVGNDHTHIHLLLYSSERAYSHAMHLKSLLADDASTATPAMRAHSVSRLHKAYTHATALCTLLSDPVSKATEKDVLEAHAYAASLRGSEAFEKSHWEASIVAFSEARIIYSVLLNSNKNELYRDQLTSTIDPSIRYSAYQLQLPRNMGVATISRKYFPREQAEKVVTVIEALDPSIFSESDEDTPMAGTAGSVSSVTWRSHSAPVDNAEISVALAGAQAVENAYYAKTPGEAASTEAFDDVLAAWQEAVDATKKAIDDLQAENVKMEDQRMQNLQLTSTVVNYSLICWRVARNRVMIQGIAQGGKKGKKGGPEIRVKKLGHLKEEVALYDAILQSLEQVYDLPGVARDEEFTKELDSKKAYFSASKCAIIAQSHALLSNRRNALALLNRALSYVSTPHVSSASIPSHKGLEIDSETASEIRTRLKGEVSRFQALVEMDNIAAKTATKGGNSGVVLERLDKYPEGKDFDFENGIVQWPPKVSPVPVKPVFLDVAWNFIEYPGDGGPRAVVETKEKESKAETKKGGFLGSLWGR
ncbi:uncharacterized protein LAJ45_05585 [Morchella importuna]|uniref:Signal recognition particle subunit SRP68 n=1 Tax=Morchella conica CCBAS932 TaxID=1392247 RepID=A0A3N4KTS7_9PEZI|nr:uncharacterized protein LAJ45_05585 [Morchella importuna]KAH8150374.1 hypothetical protein LAJ45_05585 [Morchella importuna]RPB13984.1 hypothetical protein P167DRAFT_504373 [Morchella conica CCBAS932]